MADKSRKAQEDAAGQQAAAAFFLFIGMCVFGYIVVDAILSGSVRDYDSGASILRHSRAESPVSFWVYVSIWSGFALLCGGAGVACAIKACSQTEDTEAADTMPLTDYDSPPAPTEKRRKPARKKRAKPPPQSDKAAPTEAMSDNQKLLHTAFDIVWNLTIHNSYGGKEGRAVSALRKRCPGTDRENSTMAVKSALALIASTRELAAKLAGTTNTATEDVQNPDQDELTHDTFACRLNELHPATPHATCKEAIARVVEWFYTR